jgi:PTH1 family peptidyl-tRNA hydrolase
MLNFFAPQSSQDTFLIVGLGNPGSEYKNNRHNIGFMAIDEIADRYSIAPFKNKFNGQIAQGVIEGKKVYLLKPQTYMNKSGTSVQAAAKFYSIAPENIFVFYDELDLPLGKSRVKKGGGSGGHNGVKSLDAHLPNPEYWRARLGIGHPGDKAKVHGYVLSDFAKSERKTLEEFIYAAAKFAPYLVQNKQADFATYMAEHMKGL